MVIQNLSSFQHPPFGPAQLLTRTPQNALYSVNVSFFELIVACPSLHAFIFSIEHGSFQALWPMRLLMETKLMKFQLAIRVS